MRSIVFCSVCVLAAQCSHYLNNTAASEAESRENLALQSHCERALRQIADVITQQVLPVPEHSTLGGGKW